MGSKPSKGGGSGARADALAGVLPRSWVELEQLHLRFQQDAHRRAEHGDPQARFFLAPAAFQAIFATPVARADKTQLLAAFSALDRKQRRRIAAVDFFCGLALVVEGKKAAKFECTKCGQHVVDLSSCAE